MNAEKWASKPVFSLSQPAGHRSRASCPLVGPKIVLSQSSSYHADPMPKAPPPSSPVSPATVPVSYEAAMGELEQLVGRLESGDLPLEQMLSGYQRGAELLQFCKAKLQAVEDQIKVLDEGTLKVWKPQ